MFSTLFGKKKLKENAVANVFVNGILETVDKGFPEVAGLINDSPELIESPQLDPEQSDDFLLVVLSGNLKFIPKHFEAGRDTRLTELIIQKLSKVFDVKPEHLQRVINDYQSYMSRVNHPSKNILYSMSKGVFYKYGLAKYQEDYFRSLNVPNPVFLKRLDEAMENFIWNWEEFKGEYTISS